MNKKILEYLKTNKDSHTKESLIEQLKNAGYSGSEIQEAIKLAYGSIDAPIPDRVSVTEQQPKKQGMSTGKKVALVVGIVFVVGIVVVLILSSVVLGSLNSARDNAKEASVKSSVSSTVPAAILCMDDDNDLNKQIVGDPICEGSEGNWPDLGINGKWGSVTDADVSDGIFEYMATYGPKGEKKAICSETGCVFDQSMTGSNSGVSTSIEIPTKKALENDDSNLHACKRLKEKFKNEASEEEIDEELLLQKEILNEKAIELNKSVEITTEDVCMFSLFYEELEQTKEVDEVDRVVVKFLQDNNFATSNLDVMNVMVEVHLEIAKEQAIEASVKSSVSSTIPAAILCMDDNGYLMEPVEGGEICRDDASLSKWPVISDVGGQWGGCKMQVNREDGSIKGFEYCAILPNDFVVHCNETGCDFFQ